MELGYIWSEQFQAECQTRRIQCYARISDPTSGFMEQRITEIYMAYRNIVFFYRLLHSTAWTVN